MYAKYQEAVDAVRHEQLGRKQSEAILQRVWLIHATMIFHHMVEHDIRMIYGFKYLYSGGMVIQFQVFVIVYQTHPMVLTS